MWGGLYIKINNTIVNGEIYSARKGSDIRRGAARRVSIGCGRITEHE
jgi:hypothetical protein